jgi:hypothetical protein
MTRYLKGFVLDAKTNEPLFNVAVHNGQTGTYSDENGFWSYQYEDDEGALGPDFHDIMMTFSLIGYLEHDELLQGTPTLYDDYYNTISMEPDPELLPQVEIVGTQKKASFNVWPWLIGLGLAVGIAKSKKKDSK